MSRLSGMSISRNRRDFIVLHFLFRDLKEAAGSAAKGRLLDIGCGNKPYEGLFQGLISDYKGCDVVQSSLGKVDVLCEATDLKFESGSFDTVFSTQVIEHVSDPFKMLSEANRVLVMNGSLIISAPFCWELHEEPYDFYRYSKYALKTMLENAGFQVVSIVPNGGKWAAIIQLWINMIYSTFTSKKWYVRILKGIFINLHLTALINTMAIKLDRKYFSDLLTLNYVVVAQKVK